MKTILKQNGHYVIPTSIEVEFGDLLNSIDKDLLEVEGLSRNKLDAVEMFDSYSEIGLENYSIEGNSNASGNKHYSHRQGEVYKPLDKLLSYRLLWKQLRDDFGLEYANKAIKESIEGSFMIHDLTNGGVGIDYIYCTTINAKNIMMHGRPYNNVKSLPPKYFESFMGETIEYIIDNSSLYAGAEAIPDFFITMAYYTNKENSTDKEIEQQLQRFVHIVNNKYRNNLQSPFTNISLLTRSGIEYAFGGSVYIDGSLVIDNVDEILRVQKIFADFFGKGIKEEDGTYKTPSFPVVTLNIVRDKIEEDYDYIKSILEPFNKFMNLNIYVGDADKFASCCRIINDVSKANSINSFGAGAVGEATVGSLRVISLSLSDIALETQKRYGILDRNKYFDVLKEKLDLSKDILYSQRRLVQKRLSEGMHTFANLGWVKLSDYFSTWGAGGLFEATKVMFGRDYNEDNDYTDEELEFAKLIPQYIERYAEDNSDDFMKFNVEFLTPLESGARRLGKRIDHKYNKKETFVSNQLLPLEKEVSISRRLEIEDILGGATSAGGILHLGVKGDIPFNSTLRLIEKIVTNYENVEHFALSKTMSYCEGGHLTLDNVENCGMCGKPITSQRVRTIGYIVERENMSAPRQDEFHRRKWHETQRQFEFMEKENE